MIVPLLSAGYGARYDTTVKQAPWLRYLQLDDAHSAVHLVVATFGVGFLLWWTVPTEALSALVEEAGPIEQPTVLLYLSAALAAWYLLPARSHPRCTLAVSAMLVAFGAREMDLHKAWDGISMLRVSFYTGDAPLDVKLAAAGLVVWLLREAGRLLLRYGARVAHGALCGDSASISIVVFLVTLVVATVLDRTADVLGRHFDLHLTASVEVLLRTLEELTELALPAIALLAMLQFKYLPRPVPAVSAEQAADVTPQ